MSRTPFFLAAIAAAPLAFSVSRDARALGPLDVEVGAIAGGGTMPSNLGSGAPNLLGFGLGGRAGVGLSGLYGGIEGMYYFGGPQTGPYAGSPQGVSGHSDMYGVDVGYSFKLPVITIRPLVGIGNFTERLDGLPAPFPPAGSPPVQFSSTPSYNTLYIQPGVTGLFSLGTLYFGTDANVLFLTSLPQPTTTARTFSDVALTLHAQVGLRF